MKIFSSKRTDSPSAELYATNADFCQVFEQDMSRLYLLSLLLTAEPELAERCFVGGLEDSKSSNPVFKAWAQSWARRRIITNAIALIKPRRDGRSGSYTEIKGLPAQLTAVVGLQAFDRFVFVMSVLEGYSERDVRLLLDCSNADINQARARALEQIAALAQQYGKAGNAIQLTGDGRELTLAPTTVAGLAASA